MTGRGVLWVVLAAWAWATAGVLLMAFQPHLAVWAAGSYLLAGVSAYAALRMHTTAGEAVTGAGCPVWLPILVYFGMIMAVRLPLYRLTGRLWDKVPMLSIALFAALVVEGAPAASLGLRARRWWGHIALGLVGWGFIWLVVAGQRATWAAALGRLTAPQLIIRAAATLPLTFPLLLLGNFAEELFFRGYVLTRLRSSYGLTVAMLGQALLFGLYHINYNLFPPDFIRMGMYVLFTFTFGLAAAYLYLASGSLIAPTIAHVLYNQTIPGRLFALEFPQAGTGTNLPLLVLLRLLEIGLYVFVLSRLAHVLGARLRLRED